LGGNRSLGVALSLTITICLAEPRLIELNHDEFHERWS
jgi:hypothetical protein